MKTINAIILSAALLASCNRQPVACFTADRTNMRVGDQVYFRNCSENAVSFKWTVSNNSEQLTSKDIKLTCVSPGQITVTLTAYNGRNSDRVSKNFTINP